MADMDDDLPGDLEQADAVAFLLAHLHGDEQLVNAQLDMHEVWKLFAATVGLLLNLLEVAGQDAAAVERTLVDWQERRRRSL